MPAGGTKNYNNARELVRNPDASSHRADPTRTHVMQQLGLQTPGFWADWAKRKINPQGQDTSALANSSPSYKPLTDMYQGQKWGAPVNKATNPLDTSAGPRMPSSAQGQGAPTNTGRTKKALQLAERSVLSGHVKVLTAMSPVFNTSVIDSMSAESINMDRQMSLYMESNPSAMMSDAVADYYKRHPTGSAANVMQTNFEKTASLYSETAKIAAKTNKSYPVTQVNKAIQKAKAQAVPSAPAYSGASLNIGKNNGYSSTYYFSPFG